MNVFTSRTLILALAGVEAAITASQTVALSLIGQLYCQLHCGLWWAQVTQSDTRDEKETLRLCYYDGFNPLATNDPLDAPVIQWFFTDNETDLNHS